MKQLELIIQSSSGLHARPAAVFVQIAKQFQATIQIQHKTKKANGKSMLSVLTLGVEPGGQITLVTDGADEDEALSALTAAIQNGLGDNLSTPPAADQPAVAIPASPPATSNGKLHAVYGIPGAPGIAIGPVFLYQPATVTLTRHAADPVYEQTCLQTAIATAQTDLQGLHSRMTQRLGAEKAAIFTAHLEILNDSDLLAAAQLHIQQGNSAAWSWQAATQTVADQLATLADPLLAARAADVRDVGNRVLRLLTNAQSALGNLPDQPVILAAHDLSPSDTAALDAGRVLGFCTAVGGANAHTAILARAMGIPAIVGAGSDLLTLANNTPVILNGFTGILTINPDDKTMAAAQTQRHQQQQAQAAALTQSAQPAITLDGHAVEVVANIGGLKDAQRGNQFGAEGVGLLRTEFLFLERNTPPTEDEQFAVYRDIALTMPGKPIVVRTLDVGGDKPLSYLPMPQEANPFLGERGIRLCLNRPEILRTQLRAILRAAQSGKLHIMFPMIADVTEWRAARRLVEEVRAALNVLPVPVGMMIEVPAAALLATVFAPEIDFFSIGTNDLTQYTMAMDRTNPAVAAKADGLHPAVLQLVHLTVQAAHAAGKWVGVCGELGANVQAIPILVGLGVDELSVSAPAIPTVKAQIRELTFAHAQKLATQALQCESAAAVRGLVPLLP